MTSAPHAVDTPDKIALRVYDARLVHRLLEYVVPQMPAIALSVGLMFVAMAAHLAQPYVIKVLIDAHIVAGEARGILPLALVYLLLHVVERSFHYAHMYSTGLAGQNITVALRSRVFRHLQRLDSSFFDKVPIGRLMTRVTTDVESLTELFSSGVVSLLGDSVRLIAIAVILWWLNWQLALVTLMVVPVLLALSIAFRMRIRQTFREVRRRLALINAYLQEAISGILVVQLFRREPETLKGFRAINRAHCDAELRSVIYESWFSALVELIGTLATAAIVWYGGGESIRGALTFGTLVAFLEYMARFFAPIRDLSGFYAEMQAAMTSLERIFALLDTQPQITDPARPATLPARTGRLEFDHVDFAYKPEEPVLRDIQLRVEPGERVAIVGATGAGKTTLMKLLVRLYDPLRGSVRLEGADLRAIPLATLRRKVRIVMQDHFLISGTIAGNITFGDHRVERARVEEAARLVRADDFIRRLPRGYDEPVRERGNNLSFGQKQLISFARALISDPDILILDEATSSVDSETEALIQDGLGRLLRGRTSLIIAHRLSTIIGADRILVLHRGRIVEEGTHRGLMEQRGVYHRLHQIQFRATMPISSGDTSP